MLVCCLAFACIAPGRAAAATIRHVPADYTTIQGAIDAADEGDTVLVAPGTYVEQVDFVSKEITVESAAGADVTAIDGDGLGVVVNMDTQTAETPVLRGFTIRNGGDGFSDGGIDVSGGPALIEKNVVTGQQFCDGGGIEARFSQATIRSNVIKGNSQTSCSGGVGGGGVSILGAGSVKLDNNLITGNSHGSHGGGLTLFAAGTPTITGNLIQNNSGGNDGGGMDIVNDSDALIENNVITGNQANEGGGVWWVVPNGSRGPFLVNNTIARNQAGQGLALFAEGYDRDARAVNNILVGQGAGAVVYCGHSNDPNPPVIRFNDVLNTGSGPRYGDICTDQTGLNGNISADPLFVDAAGGDFHLQRGSPAVDAASNADAPATDIEGSSRPQDGDGNGVAVADMGAYELAPANRPPDCNGVVVSPSVITATNHKFRLVTLAGARDPEGDPVALTVGSVTQDEPVTGSGDPTSPDAALTAGSDWVRLRAERSPQGDGRVYRVDFSASDGSGGTCTGTAKVSVPRKKQIAAIDSAPPSFDSFGL